MSPSCYGKNTFRMNSAMWLLEQSCAIIPDIYCILFTSGCWYKDLVQVLPSLSSQVLPVQQDLVPPQWHISIAQTVFNTAFLEALECLSASKGSVFYLPHCRIHSAYIFPITQRWHIQSMCLLSELVSATYDWKPDVTYLSINNFD